ncbi:MAG: glycogen synthase [Symbiobacteriaceae bacterium]|nr:glycogen synthase [Symbiobacteriaceae bacterium]
MSKTATPAATPKGSKSKKTTKAVTGTPAAAKSGSKAPGTRVLYAVSEVAPFLSTGGMGQVVGSLPTALMRVDKEMDVRVISPLYRQVRNQFGAGMTLVGSLHVPLSWRSQYCGVYMAERDGITYYFLDNLYYFDRERPYGYLDDGERFAFMSAAVLAVLELIDFVPDIIHAHDWQSALVPIYLKIAYSQRYPQLRTIFTIHNIEYQGRYGMEILGDVFGIDDKDRGIVEYDGDINLMKGAIVCCDRLTTVSPSYAEEVKGVGGFGLEGIIRQNGYKLSGIINGIDYEIYDPETDKVLVEGYNALSLEGKAANKRALQTLFGLPVAPRTPALCMVSRLVTHKGIDLITTIAETLLKDDVQLFILGTGDHQYELFFQDLATLYPDKAAVSIAYNPEISNRIFAGADIMLMPSASEPCGLAQMICCRYGTIPVVRATGGLKDSVQDCRLGDGNGFVFEDYDAEELLSTIRQAVDLYKYREEQWQDLVREAMKRDFRWDLSAKAYRELYFNLLPGGSGVSSQTNT